MDNNHGDAIRKSIRDNLTPAVGSMFKWSLASLLTINGGAVLAILQADQTDFALVRAAGTTFGLGIGGAIIAGIAASVTMVFALLKYLEPKQPDLTDREAAFMLLGVFTVILGAVGSFACFLIGLSQLNYAVANGKPKSEQVVQPQSQPTTKIRISVGGAAHKSRNSDCGIVGMPPKGHP